MIEQNQEIEKQTHSNMELSKGIYLGDMDNLIKSVESQMPVVQDEQIYRWELEKQFRIYIVCMMVSILVIMLGVLI